MRQQQQQQQERERERRQHHRNKTGPDIEHFVCQYKRRFSELG